MLGGRRGWTPPDLERRGTCSIGWTYGLGGGGGNCRHTSEQDLDLVSCGFLVMVFALVTLLSDVTKYPKDKRKSWFCLRFKLEFNPP